MRSRFLSLITAIGLSLAVLPAQAQVNDRQTNALVEALRQAAPQTGRTDDGLYSEWQVMPGNIGRWSRSCIGRELSPSQFETSPATARSIVACVMRDVLQAEYRNSDDEAIAVRRAAAWWMTGDSSRYNRPETRDYTNRVLSLYQQQIGTATAQQPSTQSTSRSQSTAFDRYMRAGYAATNARDYPTALLYFRRAIDERPNNQYAQQAIQNVERYLQPQ
ncbi:hypothetical protein H6F67_08375 [Microcoleus sp. FACHB-1515]|uniref:hypothetical protein n=1 Tax=Cyanophyceae TaxID=3028117 RepID=UPI001682CF29|nr:hypothetical protein [Microcoleus sp. FACHB-1515]MBD2089868.1 hypothetical protein [Microcoleus sp. FACHB-1515]